MPAGLREARFRQDEPGLVVTADGDYLGGAAVLFYRHKRGEDKERQVPSFSPTPRP